MNTRHSLENHFFKLAGVAFLTHTKLKNFLQGYTSPRPFPATEIERGINYDIAIVDKWLSFLERYVGTSFRLQGKEVLELGPGADLGVGLYLLANGAARYNAIDVNNLIATTPQSFYHHLFHKFEIMIPHTDIDSLKTQLYKTQNFAPDRLNYTCRSDFDIADAFPANSIDVIFSQASFEHFDNVEETIKQISTVAKPGAKLVAEVDLMTHSRWIRDKDPNNIYRYSEAVYKLFHYKGRPNRVRPYIYKRWLEQYGWNNVLFIPDRILSASRLQKIKPYLDREFQDEKNQMDVLTFIICATKE